MAERKRRFVGQHFWARGYFVSTVGRDEAVVPRVYPLQENEDQRLEQLNLCAEPPRGGTRLRGRVSDPTSRLGRPQNYSPRLCRGSLAGTGNAGVDEGHWHGEAKAGHPVTFDWIMQRRDPTQNKLEIWYDGETAAADITLGSPRGPMVPIDPGATRELVIAGVRVGIAEHRVGMRGRLSCVRLLIHPPFLPAAAFAEGADTFAATLRVASADATQINAWIERDDGAIERSWLSPSHPSGSLCCLATVPHALVVAGYDHHRDTVDRWPALLPASSLGPAPWVDGEVGRVPHFAAPARCIWGARSKSQGFVETTGTSAAVALVSGAIAHHLGVHGAGATLPARAGEWSPRFGYRRFRIDASDRTGVDQ